MPSADWSTGLCAAQDAVRIIASEVLCFLFFLRGIFLVRQSCVEIQLISWCMYRGNKLLPHFSG